jgi:phage terminase small subunit
MAEKPPKTPFSVVSTLPLQVPDPPRPLGPAGLAMWRAIQAEYNIVDQGGIAMLLVGCHAFDRAERLRAQIDADGEVIRLRNGSIRAHPAIRDEVACRAQVMRAIEKLGLNFEAVKPIGRPPGSFNR